MFEIKEADYQTTCCCCFKTRVARGAWLWHTKADLAHKTWMPSCVSVCMKKGQFQWTRAWNGALHAWKTRFVVLVWICHFLWDINVPSVLYTYIGSKPIYIINWATTYDFQLCGILTSVESNEPVQPPFKRSNSKRCSVSSLTLIEYSSD